MPTTPDTTVPFVPQPPVAERRETSRREFHGDVFVDPYEWLRDKADPTVIAHLEAENAYTEAITAPLAGLAEDIFCDIQSRTLETDLSVPSFSTDAQGRSWWSYRRTVAGREYPVYCRVPASSRDDLPDMDAIAAGSIPEGEQVLLDGNAEAEGHAFFSLGALRVSPSGDLLAFSVDHAGDERYDLFVRHIDSGRTWPCVQRVGHGVAWCGDGQLIHTRVDAAWRPFQAWRHTLQTDPSTDALLFEEPDDRFWVDAWETRDRRWIVIGAETKLTSEVRLLPTDDPAARPRLLAPRQQGLSYTVDVTGDQAFIVHDAASPDFQVSLADLDLATPDDEPLAPQSAWRDWLGPTDGVRYTGVDAYESYLVVARRRDGLAGIDVVPRDDPSQVTTLQFPEEVHEAVPLAEDDPDTDRFRIRYDSLVTPTSILEYQFDAHGVRENPRVLRRTPVLDHPEHGAYDPTDYVTERQWATADDGRRIPLSIVRHRDVPLDGTAPCLLYGYGSYEISIPPTFAVSRLSLLDRDFVFCLAHPRGGGEMGRHWYDEGKMLAKRNTFTDFVAAGRWLVDHHYTSPDRLVAEGRSAGGLLMGAITNLAPDLFAGVHAGVAFVDALTTILDADLPLTVIEWEEWGNPVEDAEVYACMKSYTPYENIRAERYPAILATTSLNDTRVLYVEPAKWVQELRHTTITDADRPVLLRTEMVAGHGGVSGRYAQWRDRAFELAWIIDAATNHR